MVSVKVVSKNSGKPVEGKKVSLGFDGFSRGVTGSEYTDSSGEAHFDADPGDGQVFVDGTTKHKGRLSGRVVVYI
jgi:uncharacterized protein YfaS (alpha-2-macroglobulin family)